MNRLKTLLKNLVYLTKVDLEKSKEVRVILDDKPLLCRSREGR